MFCGVTDKPRLPRARLGALAGWPRLALPLVLVPEKAHDASKGSTSDSPGANIVVVSPDTAIERVLVRASVAEYAGQRLPGAAADASTARDTEVEGVLVDGTLVAVLRDGTCVTTQGPAMRCRVRSTGGHLGGSPSAEVEEQFRTMLGLGSHRPPRLAWRPLIDALAERDLIATDDDLLMCPLTIELASPLRDLLAT